ncbi:MAG: thiamine pyrophosphate-dependent dehydrogenase E1 component subunit alpha [Gemmataceae bacterium]
MTPPDDEEIDPLERSDSGSPRARTQRNELGTAPAIIRTGKETLSVELALTIYRQMVRTRALEERSIKMSKSGEAYFWIGGPGEEAFNVCLGLQIHCGQGPAYDYLHLHYRNAGVLLAMGMTMADHMRQLAMTSTDPHSRGRNFVGHYAVPAWNVVPVSSVIEVQYLMAPGTALVQRRHGGEGLTVVVGGDAGTAEGDFESCMNWSTRPGQELPVLMVVTNNQYGISTPAELVHGEKRIADRSRPYHIRSETIDGNDPIIVWNALDRAMRVCRKLRRPFLLEAIVSRLHGHSSSSGAQRVAGEIDPLTAFGQKLLDAGALDVEQMELLAREAKAEADAAALLVVQEPKPTAADVLRDTYAPSAVDQIYPMDYDGLPGQK